MLKVTFFVPSVIGIVAATVCFLMSLLFPVKCSYLNAQSLPFVLTIPCSGAVRVEGRRGAASSFSEFAKLENTISKSQHKLLSKCTRCLFQNAWKKNITVQVHRDEKSSYEYNYYLLSACANSL